jgi:dihydrofolate synthase/folylpolyglutamate synthase
VSPDDTDFDSWLQRLEMLHPKAVDLGLERIGLVLERLGVTEPGFKVITVAGTNGKGSTVAMLESALRGTGRSVAALTSPHLWRFNERVRIDGRMASDAELISWFEAVELARDGNALTFFEFTTAAALLGFHRSNIEVGVLEVGLGGRLDAVNAIDPDVAIITSVDLDHQNWLGATRDRIGYEKAGIFRPGKPAIVGDPDPPATVAAHAAAIGATLYRYGPDFRIERRAEGLDFFGMATRRAARPDTASTGQVEGRNLACVLAALECMGEDMLPDSSALSAALGGLQVPGRFQRLLVDGVEWILDVAHNPAAATNLARQLASEPRRRTHALIGMMEDKDSVGVARALADRVDCWITLPIDRPRGQDAETLAARLREGGARDVRTAESVEAACVRLGAAAAEDERVVVLGSFYVVAPVAEALGLYCAAPARR